MKPHKKTTAVVNPLPLNKSQEPNCESKSETELSSNNDSRQSSQEAKNEPETSEKTSLSRSEEINRNEVIFTSPKKSPRKSPKKKVAIKCKQPLQLEDVLNKRLFTSQIIFQLRLIPMEGYQKD